MTNPTTKLISVMSTNSRGRLSEGNRVGVLAQGAEAKILLNEKNNFIIKDRISKSYRIKQLDDKIRKSRTKSEAKLLIKASKIINSPEPFFIPDFYQIKMPFIDGKKLSEHLDSFPLKKQKEICKIIGQEIAKIHEADIIHGDSTTSNMILVKTPKNIPAHSRSQINKIDNKQNLKDSSSLKNPQGWVAGELEEGQLQIFFIDFGLGYISRKIEDKAVDLHLLKQALEAKHFKNWEVLFNEVIKGYKKTNEKEAQKVLERLKAVEKRGRYKER